MLFIPGDNTAPVRISAALSPIHETGFSQQNWTLLTLDPQLDSTGNPVQLKSNEKYFLTIPSAAFPGQSNCYTDKQLILDTAPTITYVANAKGTGGKLSSRVAFANPGKTAPIRFSGAACGTQETTCIDIVVNLKGNQVHIGRLHFDPIDMKKIEEGEVESPVALGTIGVDSIDLLQAFLSRTNRPNDPGGGSVPNIGNVLVGTSSDKGLSFAEGPLTARNAPATKALAWLWINGTVTAATGAAPAWVLDGKLDGPSKQLPGTFFLKAGTATANVGNNKIDGQSAKDVIDFAGPSLAWLHDGSNFGSSVTVAPTYETNLALSHRNLLVAGDAVISWRKLNRTQAVQIAQKYYAGRKDNPGWKIPSQGDFKCVTGGFCPPKSGWSLTPHLGFEAGGALATSTVKNPNTKAVIGVVPTYSIGRFVPQIDGLYQYRNFSLEDYLTGRYLFATEHTAVNNRAGIPYLETVSGWKAVNVLTFIYSPGVSPHVKFTVAYTDGFSAPTYQRANGVKIGLAVAY